MARMNWERAKHVGTSMPSRAQQRLERAADGLLNLAHPMKKPPEKSSRTVACQKCRRLFGTAEARDQHVKATHADPSWEAGKVNSKFRKAPICPLCDKPARVTATKYGPRAECCGLHSWDLKPLVSPATHDARKSAHAAFDLIWRGGKLSRGEAYRRLAQAMQLTSVECHISQMGEADAKRVVAIVTGGGLRENEKDIAT